MAPKSREISITSFDWLLRRDFDLAYRSGGRKRYLARKSILGSLGILDACSLMCDQLVVRTPAKLNLFLELLGKRPDGYHDLETVMVPVSCFDTLQIARTDEHEEIRLSTRWWPSSEDWKRSLGDAAQALLEIPDDESNLIHRAVSAVKSAFALPGGFDVKVRKRIPAGAGMGGASSDAAAAILATASLCEIAPRDPELWHIAERIGSDVPFFLAGGPALATGRGEKLRRFTLGRRLWFVVAYPRGGLSTAAVYRQAQIPQRPQRAQQCLRALTEGDAGAVHSVLMNRLAQPARALSPLVGDLLDLMNRCGMATAMMTGSGSACFSVYSERDQAVRGARRLEQLWSRGAEPGRVLVVSSVSQGPRLRACF